MTWLPLAVDDVVPPDVAALGPAPLAQVLPGTADHQDRAHVGALLEHLETDGALPGDHVGVLERMDEHRARALGVLRALHEDFGERLEGKRAGEGEDLPAGRGAHFLPSEIGRAHV